MLKLNADETSVCISVLSVLFGYTLIITRIRMKTYQETQNVVFKTVVGHSGCGKIS